MSHTVRASSVNDGFAAVSTAATPASTTQFACRTITHSDTPTEAQTGEKVDGDRDQRVERKQLHALEPGGLSVQDQIRHDRHRQADGDNLERRKNEVERMSQ